LSKITESARNEQCTLRIPNVCNYDSSTTVWAHSNRSRDGKGLGLKANDENGAYACYACHSVYDRQRPRPEGMTLEQVESYFTHAMNVSRLMLIEKGVLSFENFPQKTERVGRLKMRS
jgi:hypothetical protein